MTSSRLYSGTVYCFRADTVKVIDLPIGKAEEKEEIRPVEAIYCKICGRTVTNSDQKISVRGSHTHTFFNPVGVVYELGCFGEAPGCYRVGEVTSEFTWFAGFVWCYALCRGCNNHLGWFFEMGERSFYGLILANITEY